MSDRAVLSGIGLALALALPMAAPALTLDFDRAFVGLAAEDAGGNTVFGGRETINGEIVADENGDRGLFVDEFGVEFSVTLANNALAAVLFETDCNGNGRTGGGRPDCTGGDPDLATGAFFGSSERGRLLIFQEDNAASTLGALDLPADAPLFAPGAPAAANAPEGYATADDAAGGGNSNTVTYNFLEGRYEFGVDLDTLALIDFEEGGGNVGNLDQVVLGFTYADGRAAQSIDLADPLVVFDFTNEANANVGSNGDNSEKIFDLAALGDMTNRLRTFSITLNGISGGLETLSFDPSSPPSTPVPLPPSALLLGVAVGLVWLRRRPTA